MCHGFVYELLTLDMLLGLSSKKKWPHVYSMMIPFSHTQNCFQNCNANHRCVRKKNSKKNQHASCTDVGVIWHEIHLLIGTLHFAQSSFARLTGPHEISMEVGQTCATSEECCGRRQVTGNRSTIQIPRLDFAINLLKRGLAHWAGPEELSVGRHKGSRYYCVFAPRTSRIRERIKSAANYTFRRCI